MANAELILTAQFHERLLAHLRADEDGPEQAAFLFCQTTATCDESKFVPRDAAFLSHEDFETHMRHYLELRDETKASLIKRAHDLKSSIVEFHSHPGQFDAEFSFSDLDGFNEFVPHVRWRLRGRPYIAIVCGATDFDSLVWQGSSGSPDGLADIVVDGRRLFPTGRTLATLME